MELGGLLAQGSASALSPQPPVDLCATLVAAHMDSGEGGGRLGRSQPPGRNVVPLASPTLLGCPPLSSWLPALIPEFTETLHLHFVL